MFYNVVQLRTDLVVTPSMLAAGRSAAEVARLFQAHRATISRLNAAARQTEAV
jgi:hypothetical protein